MRPLPNSFHLSVLLLATAAASAQASVGPWTLTATGNSFGNVVACATNAPSVQATPCATLKAVSNVTGPPGVTGSTCNRIVNATTTLTVGPGARYVKFELTLTGLLDDDVVGETCNVAALVTLDGATVLGYSPLPPDQLTPCRPASCVPLPVAYTTHAVRCLRPGTYTVGARLGTYVFDSFAAAGQSTVADFFTGPNGLVVCVTDQGPCTSLVSPVEATVVEGSSNNVFPFQNATVRRYQQIHGDLPAQSLSITRLSFRANTTSTATTYSGTRSIDIELYMGNGPASHAGFSRSLAQNFAGPRSLVIARRALNWGPYGTTVGGGGPESFEMSMHAPLDAPFLWSPTPTSTLTWEAVIHGSQAVGANPAMDADASSNTVATPAITGTGCVCTSRTTGQTLSVAAADVQGYFALGVGVGNGPPSAPVLLSIGTANWNLPVPGLCSPVLTDLSMMLPVGTTSATGAIANIASEVGFVVPNNFPGAQFYLQAHAIDAGQAGMPICNSEGRTVTVPFPNTSKVLRIARMFDSSGTTTATTGLFFTTSTLGYGLVTRFE